MAIAGHDPSLPLTVISRSVMSEAPLDLPPPPAYVTLQHTSSPYTTCVITVNSATDAEQL